MRKQKQESESVVGVETETTPPKERRERLKPVEVVSDRVAGLAGSKTPRIKRRVPLSNENAGRGSSSEYVSKKSSGVVAYLTLAGATLVWAIIFGKYIWPPFV